jgi:hypothetical protein
MIVYDKSKIQLVKNFATLDEIKILNDYLDSMELKNFKDVFYFDAQGKEYNGQREIFDESIKQKMKELDAKIKLFLSKTYFASHGFNVVKFNWTRPLELIRWQVGSTLGKHSDGSSDPENFPLIKIGTLIYLNNDYDGGELVFNDYDIIIKPDPGDLVIFPNHYMHEVLKVLPKGLNTRRHTMPTFYVIEIEEKNEQE